MWYLVHFQGFKHGTAISESLQEFTQILLSLSSIVPTLILHVCFFGSAGSGSLPFCVDLIHVFGGELLSLGWNEDKRNRTRVSPPDGCQ